MSQEFMDGCLRQNRDYLPSPIASSAVRVTVYQSVTPGWYSLVATDRLFTVHSNDLESTEEGVLVNNTMSN
jgi:hypothetical protein